MKIIKISVSLALVSALALFNACKVEYSLRDTSIPPAARTFSVAQFPNNAAMVSPILSNTLTEALKDRFVRQTKLTQVSQEGDFALEGEIVNYTTAPAAISAGEYALKNRLTITVQVRFNNAVEPQYNFSRSFSAFSDYDANLLLQSVEGGLIEEIVEILVDNIFNACTSNW